MERIVSNGYSDCTVILDGTECRVTFDNFYYAFAVMNDSEGDVFVSIEQGRGEGEDNVRRISPGCSSVLAHNRNRVDTVYVTGSGKVRIVAQNGTENPFKSAPVDNGGGGRKNGEYIFPDGTEYEDIWEFIGDDVIIDKDIEYGVCGMTKISESDPTRQDVFAAVVDSDGNFVKRLYGYNAPISTDWRIEKLHVTSDGYCEITASYLNSNGTRTQSSSKGYNEHLKCFGESGHILGVSNNS